MSVVPVILSGVFYPKNKKDPPLVGTFVGNAAIYGLEVGGGPIEPPPEGSDGDEVIWGGGNEPFPTPPIWWEGFPNNPPPILEPPPEFPGPGPIKPFPEDGGWGYSERTGWIFKPPAGVATPKRK